MIREATAALLAVPLLLPAAAPVRWELDVMDVPEAHRVSQGENITVAVLDTGVVAEHPEFKGRVSTGPDLIGGGARPGQSYWGAHGTAMASNVLSVAPKARVLSVRVIWDEEDPARERYEQALKNWTETGTADDAYLESQRALAKGIRYAVGQGAEIISMSLGTDEWGAFQPYEEDVAAAVDHALGKGVILLASSGNGGSTSRLDTEANNVVSYPAAYAGVIGVAAMAPGGQRAGFSQVHTYTSISAPGVDIRSALNTGGYEAVHGTSPACALAAGAVALMLSRNPDLSPRQVRDILVRTATKPEDGYTVFLGHGLVNADAAVRAAGVAKGARIEAVPYKGGEYFGKGPVDSPITHPPISRTYMIAGGVGVGVGLLCFAGAFLLIRRRRA
ncbi:S8 family serine peptidase [Nonomuraea sp. K274]|uniref:S8 family serine peptidase n=1 Tax=Nonomuraea cypriaca TaxID=1187855 RepID=A0A931A941_9ACTN|nr:S8 family serine peptidase [Nonomuraea cypriaca]MBF8188536.1 S8 family serine peptidase [Nonomuraea cypriaca]